MSRIKLFAATALAVGAVGVGGLAAAPSASALPSLSSCGLLKTKGNIARMWGNAYYADGDYGEASIYFAQADAYYDAAAICYASL